MTSLECAVQELLNKRLFLNKLRLDLQKSCKVSAESSAAPSPPWLVSPVMVHLLRLGSQPCLLHSPHSRLSSDVPGFSS